MKQIPFFDESNVFQDISQNVHEVKKEKLNPIKSDEPLIQAIMENTRRFNEICEIVKKAITESFYKVSSIMDELAESIARFQDRYKKIFDSISFPPFDEKWLQASRYAYEKWGEYGWTAIRWAPVKSFLVVPASQSEANAKALSYCNSKHMEILFSDLLETHGLKRADLVEAIENFRSRRYKSCACILFSLIDGILIRSMKKGKGKQRFSGKKAAEKLNANIENANEISGKVFHLLSWTSVFAALKVFFEPDNDFKTQPSVLGRNWLDHGMLHRQVKRMDCIQLFLLVDNLLEMKEMLRRTSDARMKNKALGTKSVE